jgi:hypothetical protein
LSIDLAFHWGASNNPGSPVSVLRTLFVDTDPGSAWWLTTLGVAAHVMFFGVFALMLMTRASKAPEEPKQNTPSPPSSTARASSAHSTTTREGFERLLQEHVAALGPVPRAELLHVLMLPDYERAERIGGYYEDRRTRTLAQLLIELEESSNAREVVASMLHESGLPSVGSFGLSAT